MARLGECEICCDKINRCPQSKYYKVECPSCDANICRVCTRKYLLTSADDPHCMSCKSQWDRETFIKATLKSFVFGKWKEHHSNMLLDKEMGRLPSTMPAVENYKACQKLEVIEGDINDELKRIELLVRQMKYKQRMIREEIDARRRGGFNKGERRAFIKKCPGENCEGFLSTQYKCELCGIKVCPKCFAIENAHGDGETKDAEHICNEDDLKSAELIRKETRNCPSCGTGIYKIAGCDQMWCTQCHTPFSWKTGKKVNGVIHNPHFYAWRNAGGGGGHVNAPGAVMCGGLPRLFNFRKGITTALEENYRLQHGAESFVRTQPWKESNERTGLLNIYNLHRAATHFGAVELDNVRTRCNRAVDNEDLRIRYMMKEIDKKEMKAILIKRDTQREKALAILQIYELVNTIFTETVRDTYENIVVNKQYKNDRETPLEVISRNLERCDRIRKYANAHLARVSVMYNQTVNIIHDNFYTTGKKFSRYSLNDPKYSQTSF